MFRFVKKIIVFLWGQKKLLFLICFLTAFFFTLRFPWNDLLAQTVKNIQKQYPSSVQTDFDKLYFKFFPPGIELSDLSFSYKKKTFLLDRFQVSIFFRKWLAFKQGWRFQAVKGSSFFYLDFWKEKRQSKESPEAPFTIYFLKAFSPSLDLEAVRGLFPNMKMAGKVKIRFDYEGLPERIQEAKSFMSLEGKALQLLQTELKTHIGSLSLPPIHWKEGSIVTALKDGELVFKKFRLGSPSDDLIVQIKGSAALKYSYSSVQVDSYDLKIQIDADKKLPMKLLNLMFAGYKEDRGSFWRYRLRLTGQGGKVPDMEKISEF